VDAADRAVDVPLGMDVVLAASRPPDGVGGALYLADAAPYTFVGDEMGHVGPSVYLNHYRAFVDVDRIDATRAADQIQLRRAALTNPQERARGQATSRLRYSSPARMLCLLRRK